MITLYGVSFSMDPYDEQPAFHSGYGQLPTHKRRIRLMIGIIVIIIILVLVAFLIIYPFTITDEECLGQGPVTGATIQTRMSLG